MSSGIRFLAIKRKAIFGFRMKGGDINDNILILLYCDSINTKVAKQNPSKSVANSFLFHLWWNFCEFDLRFIYSAPRFRFTCQPSRDSTSRLNNFSNSNLPKNILHSLYESVSVSPFHHYTVSPNKSQPIHINSALLFIHLFFSFWK